MEYASMPVCFPSAPSLHFVSISPCPHVPVCSISSAIAPTCLRRLSLGHGPNGCLYECTWMSTKPASSRCARMLATVGAGRPMRSIASASKSTARFAWLSLVSTPSSLKRSAMPISASSTCGGASVGGKKRGKRVRYPAAGSGAATEGVSTVHTPMAERDSPVYPRHQP